MNDRELACAAQHFGMWAVKPGWLETMAAAYNAGQLPKADRPDGEHRPAPAAKAGTLPKSVYAAGDDPRYDPPLYTVDHTGVSYVSIDGQILKGQSSFGGASSVRTRQALRSAEADDDVKGIMMLIDSPGGTVAGIKSLSDEVARIRREGRKPIVTHAEDGMHSAALWFGVQSSRVTASAMTEIGSIGVLAVLHDTSKMAEQMGVKVHVVSTGPMKGAGAPGTEITDEIIGEVQSRVDEINQFFLQAVKQGRGMGIDDVRKLADGRDWLAAEAKDKGLIDEVMSQDDAVRTFRVMIRERSRDREMSLRQRANAIRLAELQ